MNEKWSEAVVTGIHAAVYVAPGTGHRVHRNRPYHGFVLNDEKSVKDYFFDDGRVMRTEAGALFYLPEGSNYDVKSIVAGGCYAINFYSDNISDKPFCVNLKNNEKVLHSIHAAVNAWKNGDTFRVAATMKAVYDIIYRLQKEAAKTYMPGGRVEILMPALKRIDSDFTDRSLTVFHLAELCGVSEVYLRRLFGQFYGMSPKEYIVKKRIDYAAVLLKSGDFSVGEVATLCGYSEPCFFSRDFKRRKGIAPKDFLLGEEEIKSF